MYCHKNYLILSIIAEPFSTSSSCGDKILFKLFKPLVVSSESSTRSLSLEKDNLNEGKTFFYLFILLYTIYEFTYNIGESSIPSSDFTTAFLEYNLKKCIQSSFKPQKN